jgi:type I restriction enzyme, S subunit
MKQQHTLQPKLRFPEFEGDWEENKIKNVFSIFNGYAFKSEDSVENGVRWIKIADVGINKISNDNLNYLPFEFKIKYKKFILHKGDYVVALTRPILGNKLKISSIDEKSDGALLNQRVGKILSNNNLDFIYNFLQKFEIISTINNNIAGTDPPNLSPSEINNIKFNLPSLPEQQKIADYLSTIDTKINLLEEKKAQLALYKKAMMQKLFSQEIRFKDDKGNVFPEWEEKSLGEVSEIKTGISNRQDSDLESEYTFFDRSQEIRKSSRFLFDCEAIIVAGEGSEFLPKHYIGKFDLHQRTYAIMNYVNTLGLYLFHYINFNRKYFESQAVGSTVKSLRLPMFEKMTIQIPSLPEQQKIADFLSAIDASIDKVTEQITQTQSFKKAMLQQLFV